MPHPHLEVCAAGTDRQIAIAQPTHQVERQLGRLLPRQPQRVRLHTRLDGGPHRRRRPEVAIGRYQPVQRLVRTLEVVVLDEQPDAPLTVLEVGKHRARQQLLPQRLPEPLDLAAGLRMVRPALDMPDAMTLELGLELGIAPPAGVLPALVGQDLARRTILGHATGQGLQHQTALLVMRQCQTHQIARVIVQERRHVQPLVLAQQEREQIRLPQLVRLGSLEPVLTRLRLGPSSRPGRCQPLLLQHPLHRAGRSPQPEVTPQHIPDAPTPGRWLGTLRRHDRRPPRRHPGLLRSHPGTAATLQPRRPQTAITPYPLRHRDVRHPEPRRHRMRIAALIHHRSHHRRHHVHRPALPMPPPRPVSSTRPPRLSLGCHLSLLPAPQRQENRRSSAKTLTSHSNAHRVASTAGHRPSARGSASNYGSCGIGSQELAGKCQDERASPLQP